MRHSAVTATRRAAQAHTDIRHNTGVHTQSEKPTPESLAVMCSHTARREGTTREQVEQAAWHTHTLNRRQAVLETDTVNWAQVYLVCFIISFGDKGAYWCLMIHSKNEEVTRKPMVFAEETPGPPLLLSERPCHVLPINKDFL